MIVQQPIRPEAIIQRLTHALESIATEVKTIPRKKLPWEFKGKQQLYLFKSGELSFIRNTDELLIATVYDPNIFGIGEAIQPSFYHTLRIETESEILRVDVEQAFALFDSTGLWRDVTTLLSYYACYLFYRDSQIVQQRTYTIIRNHLIEMSTLSDEYRERETILDYIQKRTLLSRSSILNVVAELKNGQYIEVKKGGYLISLSTLPVRF